MERMWKDPSPCRLVDRRAVCQEKKEEEKKRLQAEGIENVYFVTKRWIGGTLTNFQEVAKNYKKLKIAKI